MKQNINTILISNRSARHRLRIPLLESLVSVILSSLNQNNIVLSLVFVSDSEIRRLNKKYLNHDWATDVLAFPFLSQKPSNHFLGEVIISIDRAKIQAKQYQVTFAEELMRYVCHGVLHLLGHLDKTLKQKNKMRSLEDRLLSLIAEDFKKVV